MDILNNFEEVLKAALSLPFEERAKLTEQLIESLDGLNQDGATQEETNAAWVIECQRRMREIDEGKVELIDGEVVMQELRERLKR